MVEPSTALAIKQLITAARHVLIVPHSVPRPDGDCLGAALAMAEWCGQLGIAQTVFCQWPAPPSLEYLPGVNAISHDPTVIAATPYDLVIMVDFGHLANSGLPDQLSSALARGVPFINIDHHPKNNDAGGQVVLVVERAAATCEIIYAIFDQLHVTITPTMATNLMTGLMTDTQNFTNLATTTSSLTAAAELVKRGAAPNKITNYTWRNKAVPELQLWGKMLLRLHRNSEDMIVTALTAEDLTEAGVGLEAAGGVASFLNTIDLADAKAVMVLREEDGQVKGSIRTTRDDVDVSEIARRYGGGGHKKSSGFMMPGKITWDSHEGWVIEPPSA